MDTCGTGVIVIGGHVQGLGLIRSLAKEGIPVYLIDDTHLCIARFSKYCKKFFYFRSMNNEDEFIDYLLNFARKERIGKWMLMPTTDREVATLSKNRALLKECYLVPVPAWNVIEQAYNKKSTYRLANEVGVAIPKTLYPSTDQDVQKFGTELAFPAIIKPAVMHSFYKKTNHKVIVVRNKEELLSTYIKLCQIVEPSELMIQEIIPGSPDELYSFCSFFKRGEIVASCMGRRARQIPMDFGKASTFVESVNIPELETLSVKLLKSMDYYGLSEVEFKRDIRDGKIKLLEINPRTWKWHTLALRAGINLPHLLFQDMHGRLAENQIFQVKVGIKWLDLYTDLFVVSREILSGRMKFNNYISSIRGEMEFSVASRDDLLPLIAETVLMPYLAITR